MTRPNESATAKYEDIDERAKMWTIYISKGIKQDDKGRAHIVTLSRQVLALLKEIKKLSGDKVYLFPSHKNPQTHTDCEALQMNRAIYYCLEWYRKIHNYLNRLQMPNIKALHF